MTQTEFDYTQMGDDLQEQFDEFVTENCRTLDDIAWACDEWHVNFENYKHVMNDAARGEACDMAYKRCLEEQLGIRMCA
jgi:hypothetical protein